VEAVPAGGVVVWPLVQRHDAVMRFEILPDADCPLDLADLLAVIGVHQPDEVGSARYKFPIRLARWRGSACESWASIASAAAFERGSPARALRAGRRRACLVTHEMQCGGETGGAVVVLIADGVGELVPVMERVQSSLHDGSHEKRLL
jgi:hypothetical protein